MNYIIHLIIDSGLSISQILESINKITGPTYIARKDLEFNSINKSDLINSLKNLKPNDIYEFGLSYLDEQDGFKFSYNDGSWILIRISGTENLIRIYAESINQETADIMISNLIKCINIS